MRAPNGIANRVARKFSIALRMAFALGFSALFVPLAHAAISGLSAGVLTNCMVVDGGVQCWGNNSGGMLGRLGGPADTPEQVIPAGSGVTAVAVADSHACAVVAGGAKCWGALNAGASVAAALGRGTTLDSDLSNITPADVQGLPAGSGVTAIAVGFAHSCAIVNGAAKCWGLGTFGRLGLDNAFQHHPAPVDVSPADDMTSLASGVLTIAAGADHTCATHTNGSAYCWGYNSASVSGFAGGRLFLNIVNTDIAHTPKKIFQSFQSFSIGANSYTSCGFNGTSALCVGDNTFGQLGNGNVGNPGGSGIVAANAVASGFLHTCAIIDGGAMCWGRGAEGQLGTGSTANSGNPANVLAFPPNTSAGVAQVVVGQLHTCAVVNQQVRCWGSNANHQLGIFYDNQLTVSKTGSGTGAVTSNVGNINCGGICNASLLLNTSVTLTAAPDGTSYFAGWTGITCNEGNSSTICTFPMAGAYPTTISPVATFAAKAPQTINFAPLADKLTTDSPFTVSATGGASGNPIIFASGSIPVCNVNGNTVTLTGLAGYCVITANQAGNATYLAASTVSRVFAVTAPGTTQSNAAFYRLGEDDPGFTNGQPANAVTNAAVGAPPALNKVGNPLFATGAKGIGVGTRFSGIIGPNADRFESSTLAMDATDNFIIEAWIKGASASTTNNSLIAYVGAPNAAGYGLFRAISGVGGHMGNVAYMPSTVPVSTNWQHIAFVRDGGVNKIYVNDVLTIGAVAAPIAPSTNANSKTLIGGGPVATSTDGDGDPYDGTIDDVRITTFAPGTFNKAMLNYRSLTYTPLGNATAFVVSNYGDINCNGNCFDIYPTNSVVTLTAQPTMSAFFAGWSGVTCREGSNTQLTCSILLDLDRAVSATFNNTPTVCPLGSYSPTGSLPCTPAPAGSFVNSSGATAPTLCTLGNYQPQTGQAACLPAATGNYVSTSGAIAQTPCAAGSYINTSGAATCTLANAGNFVGMTGSTSQMPCAAGSFSSVAGASSCALAPAGSYVPMAGSNTSTPCAAGTFQSNTGATSCISASIGFYVPSAGATNQTACAPGSTNIFTGSTACNVVLVTVTNANDSGPGSLREAVFNVPIDGVIDFDLAYFSVPRTISLLGTIGIGRRMTIRGPGASLLSLSGGGTYRIFSIFPGLNEKVSISDLTLTNGLASTVTSAFSDGGAIRASADLGLSRVNFLSNNAPLGFGGAIVTTGGQLKINDSTFAQNSAGNSGGAIASTTFLMVDSSTFENNSGGAGGAIFTSFEALITNSTFKGNQSSQSGGAFFSTFVPFNAFYPASRLHNVTMVQNTTTFGTHSAIAGEPTAIVTNSIVVNNTGGSSQAEGDIRATTILNATGINLGPFDFHGGMTKSYSLLPGSTAIGAGTNCPATDQRGFARVACDAGAFAFGIQITSRSSGLGSVSPSGTLLASSSAPIVFTLNPANGQSLIGVSGNCAGTLVGNTYTVTPTAGCTLVANFTPQASLTSVVSRKSHGAAGIFDLPIELGVPVSGTVTIEPRSANQPHKIVFKFSGTTGDPGQAAAIDHLGMPIGLTPTTEIGPGANEVTVTLNGIPDARRVRVDLSGVNGNVSAMATLGFLFGAFDNARERNSQTIPKLKLRSGQAAVAGSYLFDVNASGVVSAADIAGLKTRGPQMLP